MTKTIIECGNANPNGNISLFYKGSCKKDIDKLEAYRCTGCGGWFHKECILKHFKLEARHDWGRVEEKKRIIEIIDSEYKKTASEGLIYEDWLEIKKMI